MGGQPSKLSHQLSQHENAVIDRVKELRLDEDYIEVAAEKLGRETVHMHPKAPQGVDPIASDEFIRQVLNNPKNRCTIIILACADCLQTTQLPFANSSQARSYSPEHGESSLSTIVLACCPDGSADFQPWYII